MNLAYWFGVGVLGGMVLFFTLERTGLLYKLLEKLEE